MIVDLATAKAHLSITEAIDDAVIGQLIKVAHARIESLLGFALSETLYPDTIDYDYPETVPADLRHAVLMLVAHFYENREATLVGVNAQETPHGVWAIINEHRNWSFGEVTVDA